MGAAGMGFGARFLMDAHQDWSGGGLDTYLRLQNSDDSAQDYADLGFEVTVTGALATTAGITDILIRPQPSVFNMSVIEIGLSNGKFSLGAKRFRISHTFVLAQMAARGYLDARQVWEDKRKVIGIKYDKRLYSIAKIDFEAFGKEVVSWDLVCNAVEQVVST